MRRLFKPGDILGHLKLVKKTNRMGYWECLCDCGKIVIRGVSALAKKDKVSSCGCKKYSFERNAGKNSKFWKGYEDISGKYFYTIKSSAKRRQIVFNITIQDAWEQFIKQERKCAYSGVELAFRQSEVCEDVEQTASLDRIDSNKGYELDNIQWVHKKVNQIKTDFSERYFLDLCKKVAENND